jgi:aminoglycoside phosphotransferase (APT) family kinase protein
MGKMHADEVDIDSSLVARLLAGQFPQWADLPLWPVPSAGTDNAIYRLGDDMAVRLPRVAGATEQVDTEFLWLPRMSPHLPLAIPVPLALGQPGEGYPWSWSVCQWLIGESAQTSAPPISARQRMIWRTSLLPSSVSMLWAGHLLGRQTPPRGVPLSTRDASTRAAIAELSGRLDPDAVTAVWEAALQEPAWHGPPVWTHGDLLPGNLLVHEGRISAVIDFGCLGVGDPACDLIVAWTLLSAQTRNMETIPFRGLAAVLLNNWGYPCSGMVSITFLYAS